MEKTSILFLGEIIGRSGRKKVIDELPGIKKHYRPDFVFANGEHLAGGKGFTKETVREMTASGIDYFTSGNHVWDKKEEEDLLRQENFPFLVPYNVDEEGRGVAVIEKNGKRVLLVNLLGRAFLSMNKDVENPFKSVNSILKKYPQKDFPIKVLDFHAEATSEKVALGRYLDGKISLMVGSHTHVTTADEKILPRGTAYITDIGMIGPIDSVLGMKTDVSLHRLIKEEFMSYEVAQGECELNAVFVQVDAKGRALEIERINK